MSPGALALLAVVLGGLAVVTLRRRSVRRWEHPPPHDRRRTRRLRCRRARL